MANSNDQYIFQAKELLRILSGTGQEAYIVGEALRDLLLGREIKIVEIFTTLSQENVSNLFSELNPVRYGEYQTGVMYQDYRFIISSAHPFDETYKIKINAPRRHYSTSLMDFLEKKVFALNTLAMAYNNVIYDSFNGKPAHEKRIRMICDKPAQLFGYEPIRMLEAIRLVSELGLKLDKQVYKGIIRKSKTIKDVSLDKISRELALIVEGKYARRAINLLYKTRIYKKMPLFKHDIKRLRDNYHKEDGETFLATSLVRSKVYNEEVGRVLSNEYSFQMLVNLAITNPKSNYDILTLFSYGEKACVKANAINYALGRAKKKTGKIEKAYRALPVKKVCDLKFKGEDILKLGLAVDGNFMELVLDQILEKVLNKELPNEYEAIKDFVTEFKENYHEEETSVPLPTDEDIAKEEETEVEKDFSQGLFTDSDFEEKEENEPLDEEEVAMKEYEEFSRSQEALEERVRALELDNLRKDMELEIARKIKQNGMLENLSGSLRDQTEATLHKVYYDILLNSDEKYRRLKEVDNDSSNEDESEG